MMIPHDTDIERALKWLQNEAPNIQSLIKQKAKWYEIYHERFWDDWYTTAFNIDTASDFGIVVWCIILGLSAEPFSLEPNEYAWAYGSARQNFVYSGPLDPEQNPQFNDIGGNFFGGGAGAVGNLVEIRKLLKLRYVSLINNGSVHFVNKMLRHIFNDGNEWDFASGQYFYLMDCTGAGQNGALEIQDVIATYENGMATVHLRNYNRNQFIDTGSTNQSGVTVSEVPSELSYSAPAYEVVASGNQPAYLEFVTDSSTGIMTFQVLAKADPLTQLQIEITNTASSRSSILVDLAAKSVIREVGNIIGFELVDDQQGYLRVTVSAALLVANAVVKLSIGENQSIASPSAGSSLVIAAPMLTQGAQAAVYLPRPTSTPVVVMDYSVNPSTGAFTLGYMPGPTSLIGEPNIKWRGAWKGGSVDNFTDLGPRDAPNHLQIPIPSNSVASVPEIMSMEYRIGPNGVISDQGAALLGQLGNGIIPTFAGCKISVVKEQP